MIEFLAIIVICVNGECAFWADTKKPYQTQASCEKVIFSASDELNKQGYQTPLMGCIPIKWTKV